MAIVKNNLITKGLSGTFGKSIVFRSVGERTIVSIPPRGTGETSEAQNTHRNEFLKAVSFAKGVLTDPSIKAEYLLIAKDHGTGNAFSMAVKDYFNAPVLNAILAENYAGQQGERILVALAEQFPVGGAELAIKDGTGAAVESGSLIKNESGQYWEYTTTSSISDLTDHAIEVTVTDLAGNTTVETLAL